MEVIYGDRGAGKTTRLLKLAKDNDGIYIAYTLALAKHHAGPLDIEYGSFRELLKGNFKSSKKPLYIDDILLLLETIAKDFGKINGFSIDTSENSLGERSSILEVKYGCTEI